MKVPYTCPECEGTDIHEVSTSVYVRDLFEWTGKQYVHKEKFTKDLDDHFFECAICSEQVSDEAMEMLLGYL